MWFSKWFKKNLTLTNPNLYALFSPLRIDNEQYFSAARNSMDTWGLYFGKAKFRLYQQNGKISEEVYTHAALQLFNYPNPYHHWFYYAYNIPVHWGLFGVAYFHVLRNPMKKIIGYQMLYPPFVSRAGDEKEYIGYYEYNIGSKIMKISADDIIEIPYPSPRGDGVYTPILASVYKEQEILKYILSYTKKFYEEGGFLGLTFSTPATLTKQDFNKVRDALEERYGKLQNSFKITLTDSGLMPVKSAYSMKDADVTAARKELERAIYNAFKVGDILVGSAEAANRANAEAVIYQFTSGVIDPLLSYIDSVITRHIRKEYGEQYFIEHDNLAPRDQEASLRYYESGLKNGWLTIDEVREMERYNSFDIGLSQTPTVNVGGALIRVDTEVQIAKDSTSKNMEVKMLDGFEQAEITNVRTFAKYYELQRRRLIDALKVNFVIEEAFDLSTENDFLYQVLEMQIFRSMEQGAARIFSSYGMDRTINFMAIYGELQKIFGVVAKSNETLKSQFMKAQNLDELNAIMDSTYPNSINTNGLYITTASWNYGALVALKMSGATMKQWSSTIDSRTRRPQGTHLEDHITIDKTQVGIQEYFVLPARHGTDLMQYPGDPAGSPENIINCRCKLNGGTL